MSRVVLSQENTEGEVAAATGLGGGEDGGVDEKEEVGDDSTVREKGFPLRKASLSAGPALGPKCTMTPSRRGIYFPRLKPTC